MPPCIDGLIDSLIDPLAIPGALANTIAHTSDPRCTTRAVVMARSKMATLPAVFALALILCSAHGLDGVAGSGQSLDLENNTGQGADI